MGRAYGQSALHGKQLSRRARADRGQERYPVLEEKMVIDLSGLTCEERQRVLAVAERAIDHVCTVGRTLKAGAEVNFSIEP